MKISDMLHTILSSASTMLLSGTNIATKIYDDLQTKIKNHHATPTLWAVLVWDNPASLRYIRQKKKFAEKIGMNFKVFQQESNISENELLALIQTLNADTTISWYIVQLPLPKHIPTATIIAAIDPRKDVDGFHPANQGKLMIWDESGFTPCTPAGIMKIFIHYDIPLSGKNVCILGRSNIVGKPLAVLCINAGATVTSCNSHTPDISQYTQSADIVICATGQAHMLQADMISPTCIVIDVGFSVIDGKILWDADTTPIHEQGNSITPVPGWVGPMTVAMLLSNTFKAYEQQR